VSYSIAVGLERYHDDNILQLTRHDLDRLAANPAPPRFLISTPDDDITAFHADAAVRVRALPRRETRLGASFEDHSFTRNDVKNWREIELSIAQELSASRRHLTSIEGWWRSLPDYYLRQITDADDSFNAGTRIRRSLSYSKREAGGRLEQELLSEHLVLRAGFEREWRDYNEFFNERDSRRDDWEWAAQVRPFRAWGAWARLSWRVGRLDATGDLPASPITDADVSYDHHGLGAAVSLPWGSGATRGRVEASLTPEVRDLLTTDRFDVTRFGRTNHRLETRVSVTQRVWGPLDAIATYENLRSDATFDSGLTFPEEETDFRQTQFGLMLRARWTIRPR
jgi:hypothetical protein